MFLSQLMVNPGSSPDQPRPGIAWISQTYRVHQRIWMAFPDTNRVETDPFFLGSWSVQTGAKPRRAECGFLFRIEHDLPLRVLVQSTLRPNWDYAFRNAQHLLEGTPKVREFEPRYETGTAYRFRLVMQMVTRRTLPKHAVTAGVKRRTEHPIRCTLPTADPDGRATPDPLLRAWRDRMSEVARRCGFDLEQDPQQLKVQSVRNLHMKPEAGQPARGFNAALFEGIIRCTDAERLAHSVINGVGRGKAFGMGLLSLAQMR